jgi:hypothetical protein
MNEENSIRVISGEYYILLAIYAVSVRTEIKNFYLLAQARVVKFVICTQKLCNF